MRHEFQKFLRELKLTHEARKELDAVLVLPEVQNILDREEEARVAERKPLIERLAGVPKKFDASIKSAEREITSAATALARLKADLGPAEQRLAKARAAAITAVMGEQNERFSIEQKLRDGADPRLKEIKDYFAALDDYVRLELKLESYPVRRAWGGRDIVYRSNSHEVDAARSVIKQALNDVDCMALEALTSTEIAQRLTEWSARIDPLIEGFDLLAPFIDENGLVKLRRPMRVFHSDRPDAAAA